MHDRDRAAPDSPVAVEAPVQLLPLLRELDEQLEQETLPVGARNRIELSIRDHRVAGARRPAGIKRWLPAATFVAGAALVFAVVRMRTAAPPTVAPSVLAAAPAELSVGGTGTVGAFVLQGKDCGGMPAESPATSDASTQSAWLQGNCKLVAPQLTAQVWGEARVEAAGQTLRVHEGQLLFDVAPVAKGEQPVAVAVSHGTIEVVGTKFIVDQRADGGHVDLFEGSIRFRDAEGVVVEIGPGQRHRWGAPDRLAMVGLEPQIDSGLEPEIEIEIEPEDGGSADEVVVLDDADTQEPVGHRRPRHRPAQSRSERAAAIIEQVGELRAEHRYREAVTQLRHALDQRWDDRTAEVLSYELGELLHRYLGERQAACDHLSEHSEKYPGGRYKKAIGHTLEKLQCD